MSDAYRADTPDISQLTPATGRVGAPASGTYGEQQALRDIESALPAPTPGPAGAQPAPSPGGGGGLPLAPPSGALPRSIMAPTTRPSEPISTPLAQPIPVGETPSQQKRQLLEAWSRDPSLSETTRLWAQSILDSLS